LVTRCAMAAWCRGPCAQCLSAATSPKRTTPTTAPRSQLHGCATPTTEQHTP